jgi:PAS domain S-box-containing protein
MPNLFKQITNTVNTKNLSAKNRPATIKYGLAFSTILYVLIPIIYHSNTLWDVSPFLILIPSIIITAWYGGLLPGLLATFLGLLIGDYFFTHPFYTFIINQSGDIIRITLFGLIGLLISILSQRFHNALAKANQDAELVKESEKRFRIIANQAPIMIWVTDEIGNYTFFNNEWLEFRGKNPQEEKEQNSWQNDIHPKDKHEFLQKYQTAFIQKVKFTLEYRLKRFDKTFRYMSDTGVPRFNAQKEFIGYIGICEDITEYKELDKQKSTFLNVVAHELKTPIAIIRVITHVLIDQYKNKIDNEPLQDLNTELERLTILVDDILDLSRVETGKLTINKTQINLSEAISQVVDRMKVIEQSHKIIWKKSKPISLLADETRIKQVLLNLIGNAIKHSPQNTDITIKTEQETNKVVISITDEGIGINEKDQPFIFDKFYQVQDYFNKGFGLGLYISKEIVTQHEGTIWVQSKKGKGSTFYVSLPLEN